MLQDIQTQPMRRQTCCFTGHRDIPPYAIPDVSERLERVITHLVNNGIRYFGAGGALGFDTMAAQTVIKLRFKYPTIRLILVLPCVDQAARWSEQDRQIYAEIKRQAGKSFTFLNHILKIVCSSEIGIGLTIVAPVCTI